MNDGNKATKQKAHHHLSLSDKNSLAGSDRLKGGTAADAAKCFSLALTITSVVSVIWKACRNRCPQDESAVAAAATEDELAAATSKKEDKLMVAAMKEEELLLEAKELSVANEEEESSAMDDQSVAVAAAKDDESLEAKQDESALSAVAKDEETKKDDELSLAKDGQSVLAKDDELNSTHEQKQKQPCRPRQQRQRPKVLCLGVSIPCIEQSAKQAGISLPSQSIMSSLLAEQQQQQQETTTPATCNTDINRHINTSPQMPRPPPDAKKPETVQELEGPYIHSITYCTGSPAELPGGISNSTSSLGAGSTREEVLNPNNWKTVTYKAAGEEEHQSLYHPQPSMRWTPVDAGKGLLTVDEEDDWPVLELEHQSLYHPQPSMRWTPVDAGKGLLTVDEEDDWLVLELAQEAAKAEATTTATTTTKKSSARLRGLERKRTAPPPMVAATVQLPMTTSTVSESSTGKRKHDDDNSNGAYGMRLDDQMVDNDKTIGQQISPPPWQEPTTKRPRAEGSKNAKFPSDNVGGHLLHPEEQLQLQETQTKDAPPIVTAAVMAALTPSDKMELSSKTPEFLAELDHNLTEHNLGCDKMLMRIGMEKILCLDDSRQMVNSDAKSCLENTLRDVRKALSSNKLKLARDILLNPTVSLYHLLLLDDSRTQGNEHRSLGHFTGGENQEMNFLIAVLVQFAQLSRRSPASEKEEAKIIKLLLEILVKLKNECPSQRFFHKHLQNCMLAAAALCDFQLVHVLASTDAFKVKKHLCIANASFTVELPDGETESKSPLDLAECTKKLLTNRSPKPEDFQAIRLPVTDDDLVGAVRERWIKQADEVIALLKDIGSNKVCLVQEALDSRNATFSNEQHLSRGAQKLRAEKLRDIRLHQETVNVENIDGEPIIEFITPVDARLQNKLKKQIHTILKRDPAEPERTVAIKLNCSPGAATRGGYGAYPTKPIKKGNIFLQYTGFVSRKDEQTQPVKNADSLYLIGDDEIDIDAQQMGNEASFINHPCDNEDANVQYLSVLVDGFLRVFIYSLVDISVEAELLANYGENYWVIRKCENLQKDKQDVALEMKDLRLILKGLVTV